MGYKTETKIIKLSPDSNLHLNVDEIFLASQLISFNRKNNFGDFENLLKLKDYVESWIKLTENNKYDFELNNEKLKLLSVKFYWNKNHIFAKKNFPEWCDHIYEIGYKEHDIFIDSIQSGKTFITETNKWLKVNPTDPDSVHNWLKSFN